MSTWLYNEFKHIAVNFDDPAEVARYEERQKAALEGERALVARLRIARHHQVIDYGCGTGLFALAAAETGASVTAIDVSPAMLAYCQEKARRANQPNIHFHHAGYLTYQLPGDSIDFAITKFVLHHLPDFWKAIALRHIWRGLRPGGAFFLQDVVFSFPPDNYVTELEQWITAATSAGSFSRQQFETHIRDEFSTYGVAMEQLLTVAGFKITEANYYSSVQAEYLCTK